MNKAVLVFALLLTGSFSRAQESIPVYRLESDLDVIGLRVAKQNDRIYPIVVSSKNTTMIDLTTGDVIKNFGSIKRFAISEYYPFYLLTKNGKEGNERILIHSKEGTFKLGTQSSLVKLINKKLPKEKRINGLSDITFDSNKLYIKDAQGAQVFLKFDLERVVKKSGLVKQNVRFGNAGFIDNDTLKFTKVLGSNRPYYQDDTGKNVLILTKKEEISVRYPRTNPLIYYTELRLFDYSYLDNNKRARLISEANTLSVQKRSYGDRPPSYVPKNIDRAYVKYSIANAIEENGDIVYNLIRCRDDFKGVMKKMNSASSAYQDSKSGTSFKPLKRPQGMRNSDGSSFFTTGISQKLMQEQEAYAYEFRTLEVAKGLEKAISLNTKYKQESLNLLSELYYNSRMMSFLRDLHTKHGFSEKNGYQQRKRVAVSFIINNQPDKALLLFSAFSGKPDTDYYLGVIHYLKRDLPSSLKYFKSSYEQNKLIKTLYNISIVEDELETETRCNTFERLAKQSGWFGNAGASLLADRCGRYFIREVPEYREERYDAGGYRNERGVYVPDYKTRKIKIGTKQEKVIPEKVQYPESRIILTY